MNNINILRKSIVIWLLPISCLLGQGIEVVNYEYFFMTLYVPEGTTVIIQAQNANSPRWNEQKNVASGTETATLEITGSFEGCTENNAFNQGWPIHDPSFGFLEQIISVENAGKTAWFKLKANGQNFLGDKHFTYDWIEDDFYYNAGQNKCWAYTGASIIGQTIITNNDDGNGNLQFQPTNPTNLTLTIVNNHPKLDWAVSEPSFTTLKYKVQRKPSDGSWSTIASNISGTTYTDNEVFTNIIKRRKRYYYRVKAYTSYPKYSPSYSNTVSVFGVLLLKRQSAISDTVSEQQTLQAEFSSMVYPNPFNAATTINYGLPELSQVTIIVYDLIGHEVITLVNGFVNAGFKETVWDGANAAGKLVPSGMYFYRLDAKAVESGERFHQTRKMVLLR